MPQLLLRVGVIGELVQPVTQWGEPRWYPRAVLPDAPEAAAGTPLPGGQVYLGPATLELHHVETGNYRDNLATGAPRLWVVLARDGTVVTITADPAEGESFTEAGLDLAERTVETVPMPPSLATLLADFVAEHHVERVFHKRRRDRGNPESQGRGATLDDE